MTSKKDEISIANKLENLSSEVAKIEKGLHDFKGSVGDKVDNLCNSLLERLGKIKSDSTFTPEDIEATQKLLSIIKSSFADAVKKHRDVHGNISKFKKTVDKTFIEDISSITSYFMGNNPPDPDPKINRISPESELYKTADSMTESELFSAIIIEELIRNGYGSVAVELTKDVGFSEEDVGIQQFRAIGEMVGALKNGNLQPAKEWLATHSDALGPKARLLEYVLAKLDFLIDVRDFTNDPARVIACLRKISHFASEFPADFEHIMGSLVFLGQDLSSTPYADLSTSTLDATAEPAALIDARSQLDSAVGISLPILPLISLCSDADTESTDVEMREVGAAAESSAHVEATPSELRPLNAFVRAAHLFGTVACTHLHLSPIDPLLVAFMSGLRVLPKLLKVQRSFAWLTNYNNSNEDGSQTLPVSVDLDSLAYQHNIFHCPVIKEVSTPANPPIRLNCGHAISRDAYNSLVNSERRKIKCPYCPKETTRDQIMTLYF